MSSIAGSILLGISLYICTAWLRHVPSIPLLDVSQRDFIFQTLPMLTAFQIFAAFKKKLIPTALSTAIFSILVLETYRYSSSYAFRHIVIFVIGFYLISRLLTPSQRKVSGQLVLFFLFIFAALQKMNATYLTGAEFIQDGGFVKFYEMWFPGLLPQSLEGIWKALPAFSIFTEVAIALGILAFPYFFSHVVALFLLILSFVNPPVLFVYLLLLPVLININSSIESSIPEGYLRKTLSSAFFWVVIVYFSAEGFLKFGPISMVPVLLIFIGFHFYVFFKDYRRHLSFEKINFSQDASRFAVWVIPVVMIVLFAGSRLGLPSPYGFTMFSSRASSAQNPILTVSSPEACHYARGYWNVSAVVDTSIVYVSRNDCQITHPTIAGLRNAAKTLCLSFPRVELRITHPKDKSEEYISCPE